MPLSQPSAVIVGGQEWPLRFPGGYPCKLVLDYDLKEGRFKSADYKMGYE